VEEVRVLYTLGVVPMASGGLKTESGLVGLCYVTLESRERETKVYGCSCSGENVLRDQFSNGWTSRDFSREGTCNFHPRATASFWEAPKPGMLKNTSPREKSSFG